MQHFPIFLNLRAQSVIVVGGGEAAVAKLRLLLKTEAQIAVFASRADRQIHHWANSGALMLHNRALRRDDIEDARLIYAAEEDAKKDRRTAALAADSGALVNIVDNLEHSQFITPAIVDRDPVTIAIGTEGTAPVLARQIKADLEARLPSSLGPLARAAAAFRSAAEALPRGRVRRNFWNDVFFALGPKQLTGTSADNAHPVLQSLLSKHLTKRSMIGQITFTAAPQNDPELLTLKARRAIDSADIVVHDSDVDPAILELARREAQFVTLTKTPDIAPLVRLLETHANKGAHVVHLGVHQPDPSLINRCRTKGLICEVIPSVSAHSVPFLQKETA